MARLTGDIGALEVGLLVILAETAYSRSLTERLFGVRGTVPPSQ